MSLANCICKAGYSLAILIIFQPNILAEGKFIISEEDKNYWAFQQVDESIHKDSSIDIIVNNAIKENELEPNGEASREVLIKRAYFDLIGLPPRHEEIEAFVSDPSSTGKAFSELIDKLLQMPEYGERWGRHWLDVVRYAQTNGYERDDEKPNAWRYRDYVIDAFNNDKPYDRFILEQLAGDELIAEAFNTDRPFVQGGDESKIATGFYRLGVWDDEPDDKKTAQFDELDDILRTTSETFLGLTTGCARCHDHMFDPISQKDYYSLLAYFRNVKGYEKPGKNSSILSSISGGEALTISENGENVPETHVLIRGEAAKPDYKVEPSVPSVFKMKIAEPVPTGHSSGRRLALANWIANPSNPLTSRVMVNRIWQYHFGKGIVGSPNDFGQAGEPVSNLKLLDWLATEFVSNGWSVKHMHRIIMNSKTYKRSSKSNPNNMTKDPSNIHHWRMNLRRLEAETLRDKILQVSGLINKKRGGPSFYPALSGEVLSGASKPGRGWGWSGEEEQKRKSVYAYVKRTMVYPFFELFDYANTEGSLGTRPQTTVATQALLMLNSELVINSAKAIANKSLEAQDPVKEAYRIVLGREPSSDESIMADKFLAEQLTNQQPMENYIRFRPDYPPALFDGFYKILPAQQFLKGPKTNWNYYKGKWTGGYEGILNAESEFPPFALYNMEVKNFILSGKIKLEDTAERASILLRAKADGDLFDGYAVLIDAISNEISFNRHEKDKIVTLAKISSGDLRRGFLDFSIRFNSNEIKIDFAGKNFLAIDKNPITQEGRLGVSSWRGNVIFDRLSFEENGKSYPIIKIDYNESDLKRTDRKIVLENNSSTIKERAMAEFCSLLLNLNEFVYID